jgi:hypothetical protein
MTANIDFALKLFDQGRLEQRIVCAQAAMQWFTLPPRLRTKQKLREMIILATGESNERADTVS